MITCDICYEIFTRQGNRVIYTVPIRSLGNQKFYDFSKKFPDIIFELLIGKIKAFPTAQVLIMTQEILMNCLFLSRKNKLDTNKQLTFQIDVECELSAVIVDQCHLIMDANRGHAWVYRIKNDFNVVQTQYIYL